MKKAFPFFALVFSGLVASAQQKDTTQLKEVVVSSQRTELPAKDAARHVTIIDRAEIDNAPVQSLSELLEYAASVDIRQRGQFGTQADVSIRGGSFDQTLILLNGIKMTDPQTGHHSMNLPIDLSQIERIEVLQGGGSRIYGPNAFAGAINIITKKSGENNATAGIMAGEYGLYEGRAAITLNTGKVNHSLSYAQRGSDGFNENTDFEWENVYYQASANLKKHQILGNAGWNRKAFGASTFYSANFPNQFEATETQFASLTDKWSISDRVQLTGKAYYRRHLDRFELFREGPDFYNRVNGNTFIMDGDTVPSWYSGHNYHRTDSWGAEFQAEYTSKYGISSIGLDYRNEEIRSNVLGEDLDSPERVEGEHSSAFYTQFEERNNISVYAEHTAKIDKWLISGGLLYNVNSDFDDEIFPGLDIAYQVNNTFKVYGSANRSVRFPTYTDLYYTLGGAVGSINLKPEESLNYEVGTKFFAPKVSGTVALFRREGTNLIDWIRYNNSDITQAANITSLTVNGAELDATIPLKTALPNSIFEKVRISYTYLFADEQSKNFESNYVLDFLEHKFNLNLTQRVSDKVTIDWRTSYQDRLGGYTQPGQQGEVSFEPVFLVDTRVTHKSEHFKLFLEVANLLDENYVDIGNVAQPGRWMRLGIVFNTGFGK